MTVDVCLVKRLGVEGMYAFAVFWGSCSQSQGNLRQQPYLPWRLWWSDGAPDDASLMNDPCVGQGSCFGQRTPKNALAIHGCRHVDS